MHANRRLAMNQTPAELTPAAPRKFAVAFSFPGEHREYVRSVAEALLSAMGDGDGGRSRIFLDEWHEEKVVGYGAARKLQHIYSDEAELIVPFYCKEYLQKEWCGVELRAIEELLWDRQYDRVLPFRFDMVAIPGSFKTDVFPIVSDRATSEVASLILERLRTLRVPAALGSASPVQTSDPDSAAAGRFYWLLLVLGLVYGVITFLTAQSHGASWQDSVRAITGDPSTHLFHVTFLPAAFLCYTRAIRIGRSAVVASPCFWKWMQLALAATALSLTALESTHQWSQRLSGLHVAGEAGAATFQYESEERWREMMSWQEGPAAGGSRDAKGEEQRPNAAQSGEAEATARFYAKSLLAMIGHTIAVLLFLSFLRHLVGGRDRANAHRRMLAEREFLVAVTFMAAWLPMRAYSVWFDSLYRSAYGERANSLAIFTVLALVLLIARTLLGRDSGWRAGSIGHWLLPCFPVLATIVPMGDLAKAYAALHPVAQATTQVFVASIIVGFVRPARSHRREAICP